MTKAGNFYLGFDTGNGTNILYTDDGQVDEFSFVASMVSSGRAISKFDMGGSGLKTELVIREDDHKLLSLNGGQRYLVDADEGGQERLYGISCINAAKVSYNPSGEDRYEGFEDRIRSYLKLTVNGLNKVPFGPNNNLYVCVGMAPGLYTNEAKRDRIERVLRQTLEGYEFYSQDGCKHFIVSGVAVTGEGFGIYYSMVIPDPNAPKDSRIDKEASKKGYLIVDGGQGTFDTMLVKNFTLLQGTEVESVEHIGMTKAHQTIASDYNRITQQKLVSSDIQLYLYHGRLLKSIDTDILQQCIDRAKNTFIQDMAAYLIDTYSSDTDFFDQIVVTGGIVEFFRGFKADFVDGNVDKNGNVIDDLAYMKKMFSFGSKPITISGIEGNAKGYYVVCRVKFGGRK